MKKKPMRFQPPPKPVRRQLPENPGLPDLVAVLQDLTPVLVQAGFSSFVISGYRRVPEAERQNHAGAAEVPFYFNHTPTLKEAGALAQIVVDDTVNKTLTEKEKKP
jgi:hypothetical protein